MKPGRLARHPALVGWLLAALLVSPAAARVKPNGLFCEGAVLEQGVPVPVWGRARENENITVKIQGQELSTVAKAGVWRVELRPLLAGGPFTLTIAGEDIITLTNVLVGEVWVASGQSNMSFPLSRATNAAAAIASAADPQLRLFAVPHATSDLPASDLAGEWLVSAPETAANFSAVAWFFGRDLRRALKVPVGLIDASVGGTPARAWLARDAMKTDPVLREILTRYEESLKEYDSRPRNAPKEPSPAVRNNRPACLYNAMIAPIQPYALAGVIWYQGESDASRGAEYRKLFPALIKNWRDEWGRGDFPFLFVQLAPFHETKPEIREAQLLTWQRVANTAMVVTTDVGENLNIHPTQKEPVGERLALAARAVAYGESIEYSGPVFSRMTIHDHQAELSFTHIGSGLVARGGRLRGFSIAGENGVFVPAIASVDGNQITVSAPGVAKPTAVRYGWDKTPDVNLYNREGLPATPFRTDVN